MPEESRRILFAYRDDVDTEGGAAGVMKRTAEALEALGHETAITYDIDPDPSAWDVVHAVNVWAPGSALQQLKNLRKRGAAVVWQPFYLGYSELSWARPATMVVLDPGRPAEEREPLLRAYSAGELEVMGLRRFGRNEIETGFYDSVREMLGLVDRIAAISMHEVQLISRDVGLGTTPFTHAPHGVHAEQFAGADPALFREHAGVGDGPFILCVGAIDSRKNQAMLAHAVRDLGVPLVLLGPCFEPSYMQLVQAAGGDSVVVLDRVPPEYVASAYAGAAVHALPSWAEGAALANLEAAAAGTPLVVSDRSSEFEYFGELGRYVDPGDPLAIRAAIESALGARENEADRIAALQERMRELTWEKTAEASLVAYEAAIADAERRRAASPAPEPAPPAQETPSRAPREVSPKLRQFTDGLPWVRQPILDFVEAVAESLPDGTRVIDVGSGDSPYRELFEHCKYVTNDWTHSVHAGARSVDVVGPAHDLPVDSESFDVVICTEVLEHTPNPGEVFAELYRILAPGGRVFATTPFAWELHELPFDFFRYTPWALHRLATEAGFAPVAIESRNDTFATLAQLMADITTKIGTYPDGRDGERQQVLGQMRELANQFAQLGGLDARWSMPLGYQLRGWKAPVPERERGTPVEGARSFTTLAYAADVLFDPALLRTYGETFTGDDDATLAIYAPRSSAAEVEPRLLQLMSQAGIGGDNAADLLALPFSGTHPDETALAAGVDAVLSLTPPRGDFWAVPHFHHASIGDLRSRAEAKWNG